MHWAETDWTAERDQLIAAFNKCSQSNGNGKTGKKYFVTYKGKVYPPKVVRGVYDNNRSLKTFSGGDQTNTLFCDFGFTVVKGAKKAAEYAKEERSATTLKIKELSDRVTKLFGQHWQELNRDMLDDAKLQCPGVYTLGFSKMLSGPISSRDVFYVGMTTTSLAKRLRQFLDGIEDGGHHSGAKRFFVRWAGRTSFSRLRTKNKFFVAVLPERCSSDKGLRDSGDLQRLGLVAALEYFVLAKIKQEWSLEPPLNKK